MIPKKSNTFVLNVRMDIKDFAAIVSAYRGGLSPTTSVGFYARVGLEGMAQILVESGKARKFETASEANDYLIECGLRQQGRAVRAARELINNLNLDKDKVSELLQESVENVTAPEQPVPKTKPTPEEIIAMLTSGKG